ncbi:hypothetical protein Cni_G20156 [Canna indica]|uniref:DUF7903 domain-containing protein n=1 Tax=Canna indica TaxID=4628 RepID=A0AAQ3KMN4_9LILI|nr:hypothetical protein Cni_G20156 [Canna indica]
MAYIPPHMRHSGSADNSTRPPASLSRRFNQSLTLDGPDHRERGRTASTQSPKEIVYFPGAISLWWIADGTIDPSRLRFDPFSCGVIERKIGAQPLVLTVGGEPPPESSTEEPPPWEATAQRIERHLLDAATRARSELASEGEEIKTSFSAKLGKVLFHRKPSSCIDILRAAISGEVADEQLRKTFYTNVSREYIEKLQHLDFLQLGFNSEYMKEYYLVKVCDQSRNVIVSCKCTVVEGGSLQLHKIEQNKLRHLVQDISCLTKDYDVRFMLVNKRISKMLNDGEKDAIHKLISNAVLDPDVKGGVRWPLLKGAVEGFRTVGVWHVKCKVFVSQNIRVKFRYADRFSHEASFGEDANEVTLKLTGISKQLREENLVTSSPLIMIQDAAKLIWNHFLDNSHSSG